MCVDKQVKYTLHLPVRLIGDNVIEQPPFSSLPEKGTLNVSCCVAATAATTITTTSTTITTIYYTSTSNGYK